MADAITIKALQDASLDAKSLEEVVNGDEVKQVTTRLGETYPSVKNAIKTMFENGGLPATPFTTKALMTASALVDGKYAVVTDDTVNNGLYVKKSGAWAKSAYDPTDRLSETVKYTAHLSTDLDYKVGILSSTTGRPITSNTAGVRSLNYTSAAKGIKISIADGSNVKVRAYKYKNASDQVFLGIEDWSNKILVQGDFYVKICLSYTDNRNVTEEDIVTLVSAMTMMAGSVFGTEPLDLSIASIKSSLSDMSAYLRPIMSKNKKPAKNLVRYTEYNTAFTYGVGTTEENGVAVNMKGVATSSKVLVKDGAHIDVTPLIGYTVKVLLFDATTTALRFSSDWVTESVNEVVGGDAYVQLVVKSAEGDALTDLPSIPDMLNFKLQSWVDGYYDTAIGTKNTLKSDMVFSLGSFSTLTNRRTKSETRIVSDPIFHDSEELTINLAEGAEAYVLFLDEFGDKKTNGVWESGFVKKTLRGAGYIRIILTYTDERVLSEADITALKNTDISITGLASESIGGLTGASDGYYYRGGAVPSIPINADALGYMDFLATTWDTLVSEFPSYVTKTALIKDTSNTYDIYEYAFTPEHYTKTVFLIAGVHGDEYEGFWGLYYFLSNIYRKGFKHESLRDLKHDVRFIIIPVFNPWGLQNKTRKNSRNVDANFSYDFFFNAPEYTSEGSAPFSENESKAVKILADKYEGELGLFVDLHTDRYEPEWGNYMQANQLSATFDISKQTSLDEAAYLKDRYGITTTPKPNIVNVSTRTHGYKYMEAVRGVPSTLYEVSTPPSQMGTSYIMEITVDWMTNILVELIRADLQNPAQIDNAMETAIVNNRLTAYSNSVVKKIPDYNLQSYLSHKDFSENTWVNQAMRQTVSTVGALTETATGVDFVAGGLSLPASNLTDFTFAFKGVVRANGILLGSSGNLQLNITTSARAGQYDIAVGEKLLRCSALKYGNSVDFIVKKSANSLYLYVNGEPFNNITITEVMGADGYIGTNAAATSFTDMTINTAMLYNKALDDIDLGFLFKSLLRA